MLFLERLNPWEIIKNHFETLYNNRSQKMSILEIAIWFLIPMIFGFLCIYKKITICDGLVSNLIMISGIMSGFLINCLFLLASKQKSEIDDVNTLTKETFCNTSYGLLVFVAILILSFIHSSIDYKKFQSIFNDHIALESIGVSLIVFLIVQALFTVMVCIKRLNSIITQSI